MNGPVQRYGSVIGIKNGMVDQYVNLHSQVWPEVTAILERSHIRNYSIYMRKLADGRHYLFSYFEYEGGDFTGDMARMVDDPVTKRWWAECLPCLELLPDRAPGEVWSQMKEVFHLD